VSFLKIFFLDEWHKILNDNRPHLMNLKEIKINEEYYKPEVLSCEVKTLNHRLENPKANYLVEYDESI
jgi:hypothetical protein